MAAAASRRRSCRAAEWTVEEFAGKSPVKDSKITLNFGADGSLSGSSSCNRLATSYKLTGESLTIAQGAGTMMACEAPVMEQESAFLALLPQVNRSASRTTVRSCSSLRTVAPSGHAAELTLSEPVVHRDADSERGLVPVVVDHAFAVARRRPARRPSSGPRGAATSR